MIVCITNSVRVSSVQSQSILKRKFGNSGNVTVESLMYVQVCMHLDIAFIVEVLCIYLSNIIWKEPKRVLRYLQRTRDYMFTYRRLDQLEIIGYSESYFVGCYEASNKEYG